MSGFKNLAPNGNHSLGSGQSSTASSAATTDSTKKPGVSFSFGGASSTKNNVSSKSAGMPNTGKVSFALGGTKKTGSGTTLQGHGHKRRRLPSPTELITEFGANGEIGNKEEQKTVIVIPAVENRNWIQETMKRRGIYKPVGQLIDAERNREADEQEKNSQQSRKYGLTLLKRESPAEGDRIAGLEQEATETLKDEERVGESSTTISKKDETHDERVVRELISEFSEEDRRTSDLILPIALATGTPEAQQQQMSEEAAYKLDILSRPDEPTLQDYETVPVEEFGFALLRGMGWKEGEGIGKNRKRVLN
ncbi:DExH-box splicing factor binding site-domain-containing protein [Lipomyces orientalis]|uniref:DExH-box splicing factor binding site-domain-containing protein n=1 Tax=Lipomyces orientalis TaxID=1233043 RepID=A0ACC3TX38_9ASCO